MQGGGTKDENNENRSRVETAAVPRGLWETVIIILCHLLGKFQILLLPLTSLLLRRHKSNYDIDAISRPKYHVLRLTPNPVLTA